MKDYTDKLMLQHMEKEEKLRKKEELENQQDDGTQKSVKDPMTLEVEKEKRRKKVKVNWKVQFCTVLDA